MAADITGLGAEKAQGVPFLVSAGIVTGIVAAQCSSPQTAEINADKRADTLMKWVNIGTVQAILFVGIAAIVDPSHRRGIVAGGGLMILIMYGSYLHAKQSGLENPGPRTESH